MRYVLAVLWLLTGSAVAGDVEDMVKAGQGAMARMDIPLAMTQFDTALKAMPNHPVAAYERGRILLKMGQTAQAVADFTTAVLSKPDYGLAYARRGEAHMVLKNPPAAFKDFDAAIAASPKVAEVFIVRAIFRFQIGNLAGAKQDVEAALLVADATEKPVLEKMLKRMQ